MTVKVSKERENIYISNVNSNIFYGTSFSCYDISVKEILKLLWYKVFMEVEFFLMGIKHWVRSLVFERHNTKLYNFILNLVEFEMRMERLINIINSFNKEKKIPNGEYCFDYNLCPYYSVSTVAYYLLGEEYSGYCHKLKRSDMIEPGTVHRLVKVCRINLGDTYEV